MKIALNVKSFDPLYGGGERYVVNLARALVAHGHEVHVFTLREGEDLEGVHQHRVTVPSNPKVLRDWRFTRRSQRALDEHELDLVYGTGKSSKVDIYRPGGGMHRAYVRQDSLSAATRLGRTCRWLKRVLSPKEWINLHLERATLESPRLRRLIVNSDMVKEHVARDYPDFPVEHVCVLYNGVDVELFSPAVREQHRSAVREELGLTDDEVVMLLVATNFRLKGVPELLRALAGLAGRGIDGFRGLVVGKGRIRRAKRLARRLGVQDRVIFTGGRRDMPALYGCADLLVHPTYYDPCANVTLEALATGLPVVTTRFNGASGLMTDGEEGFVIDSPDEIDRLAGCLAQLMDGEVRRSAGEKARALAEKNGMEDYYQHIMKIFEEVVAEKSGPLPLSAVHETHEMHASDPKPNADRP